MTLSPQHFIKGRKSLAKLSWRDGSVKETVAYMFGPVAVHRLISLNGKPSRHWWIVTHVTTGLAVATFARYRNACEAALAMSKLDWCADLKKLRNPVQSIATKCGGWLGI